MHDDRHASSFFAAVHSPAPLSLSLRASHYPYRPLRPRPTPSPVPCSPSAPPPSLPSRAVGVLTTFLIGFLTGLVVSGWQAVADYYDWPTGEMASRGDLSGLVVGVFFAIPSGGAGDGEPGGGRPGPGKHQSVHTVPPWANAF